MNGEAIRSIVLGVTAKWAKQRRAEQREASRVARRRQVWHRSCRVTLKEAAYQVMEQAYLKASANGTLPAHARQIMYAARPHIQAQTGQSLDDQYFTQTLLPDYLRDAPEQTAAWDVVFDARGSLVEPHTGVTVPLGTVGVRNYLKTARASGVPALSTIRQLDDSFPTAGPRHRFGAILFIEKEGFMPLFERVMLAERYDLSLMSTKGLSTTASRALIDALHDCHPVPLLVLHDFDKSGFSILGTLQRDTRRYEFANHVRIIDLGLRLADVDAQGLESEEVAYGKSDPRPNLRDNGATEAEIGFLCDDDGDRWSGYRGRRVELNALASDRLVAWIEQKLQANGIEKVLPDDDTLALAFRRAATIRHINKGIERLTKSAVRAGENAAVPDGLRENVLAQLRADPTRSWDQAVAARVEQRAGEGGTE